MKTFLTLLLLTLVVALSTSKCTYVDQTEVAFKYNVLSGKPVTPEDNPLLTKGFHFTPFGWNTRYFSTSSEIQEYTFTSGSDDASPYDESLAWDSNEGVTMATDFTIRGRVENPWEFYLHYGESEFSYHNVFANAPHVSDEKTYEALRQAGQYAEKVMVELTEFMGAEDIRTHRNDLKKQLIEKTRPYSEEFGFYIEDIIFPERFYYPDGNVIETARQEITATNTKIRQLEQELQNAASQKTIDVENARIEAKKIVEKGQREANRIDAETKALAEELAASIEQIGPEATVLLKMAELNGQLTRSGVINEAYLNEDSIFAAPFYGRRQGSTGQSSSRALTNGSDVPKAPVRTTVPHPGIVSPPK